MTREELPTHRYSASVYSKESCRQAHVNPSNVHEARRIPALWPFTFSLLSCHEKVAPPAVGRSLKHLGALFIVAVLMRFLILLSCDLYSVPSSHSRTFVVHGGMADGQC